MGALLLRRAARRGHWWRWDEASATCSTSGSVRSMFPFRTMVGLRPERRRIASIFRFSMGLHRKRRKPVESDINDTIPGSLTRFPEASGIYNLKLVCLGRDLRPLAPAVAERVPPPDRSALRRRYPEGVPSAAHQRRVVLAPRARPAAAPRNERRAGPTSPCGRAVPLGCILRRNAQGRSPAAPPRSDEGSGAGSAST